MKNLLIIVLTVCSLLGFAMTKNSDAGGLDEVQRSLDILGKRQAQVMSDYKQMKRKKSIIYVAGAFMISFGFGYYVIVLANTMNKKRLMRLETKGIEVIPAMVQRRLRRKGAESEDDIIEMFKVLLDKQTNPLLGATLYSTAFGGLAAYLWLF